jgi:hypothetical protein
MGNYAECWVGPILVGSTKNDFDPSLMQFFRDTDRVTLPLKDLPSELVRSRWFDNVKNDEDVTSFFYKAPVRVVRDRMNLRGYTLEVAAPALTMDLRRQAARLRSFIDEGPNTRAMFEKQAQMLQSADAAMWLSSLEQIRDQKLHESTTETTPNALDGTLASFMLKQDWLGYSGPDPSVPLRLVLEVSSDQEDVIYDLTDLVLCGYLSTDDELVCEFGGQGPTNGKVIIMTEGKSDSWIISESLALLYPHLSDYFTFMDFDGARVSGSASSLAHIVKAFVGAGIVNRVVALFDNDSAAEVALRSLRSIKLPENIAISKLPDLPRLEAYPTIGPTGPSIMNVNGMAASIELYLGAHALTDERGISIPVQWTGYESSVSKYQGEVLFKDRVQERFKNQIKACQLNRDLIKIFDWSGIDSILTAIFVAFRQLDARLIRSSIDQYYKA